MRLGFLMDPLHKINLKKDTTFAMMVAAAARGFQLFVIMPEAIWLQDGMSWGRMQAITLTEDLANPFLRGEMTEQPLVELDALLMRKDPPVTMDYFYLTYLLELAESQGLHVINKPASLRDANEKLFTAWFPHCCPKTLVTSQSDLIVDFIESVEHAVIKPLDSMGGDSIFHLSLSDLNHHGIIETVTKRGAKKVMVQQFIPEIVDGDKRVLMIDGEAIGYALARIPAGFLGCHFDHFRGQPFCH